MTEECSLLLPRHGNLTVNPIELGSKSFTTCESTNEGKSLLYVYDIKHSKLQLVKNIAHS